MNHPTLAYQFFQLLVLVLLVLPAGALLILAVPAWFRRRMAESTINFIVGTAFGGATVAATILAVGMLVSVEDAVTVSLGAWYESGHYHFEWTLVADHLSVPFAWFTALLVGLIGAFARRYLHLEQGYRRFYLLLALFGTAVELVVLAGNLDLAFFGWEVVGLTSALLIAYYGERRKPVEHGFRAFLTYRACDVGLLAAAVWLHHTTGTSAVLAMPTASTPWAGFVVPQEAAAATAVGLMLLWASMGKAAQAPLGGWLPRAMEGPTPSSAIFYGAISIHLGPYLLLRAGSILDHSPVAATAVATVGLVTAFHATFVGRTQTDIKSALAYASMTQVGLIFFEIGLGFRYLALAHIVGHSCIRSLQILRSPSLLHDHHHLEQAMGDQLPKTGGHLERLVPARFQPWLYRHALERGYFDALLTDYVVHMFVAVFERVDALDRAWTDVLLNVKKPRRARSATDAREVS